MEANGVKHEEMKDQIKKEYIRRVRNILKSKLNGGNIILAFNSRAVSIIRYGAGIISWTKMELEELDRRTRNLMTMYEHIILKQILIDYTGRDVYERDR